MASCRSHAAAKASSSVQSTAAQVRTGTGSRGMLRRGRGGSCGRAAPLLLCVAISLSHVRSDATIPTRPPPDSAPPRTDFPPPPMGRQTSGEAGQGGWGRGAVLRLRGAGDQATWIGDMAMVGGAGSVKEMEGALYKHPFGHAGFEQRLVGPIARGDRRADTSAVDQALQRWERELPPETAETWGDESRCAVWTAASWEHSMRELREWQNDRATHEALVRSEAWQEEGERRMVSNQNKLIKKIAATRTEAFSEFPAPFLARVSPGLYHNITSGVWYDCRPPRTRGKKQHPPPDVATIVGHRPDATADAMPPRRVKQDMVKDVIQNEEDVERTEATPGMHPDWRLEDAD
ncbi:hypothetical protein T484DRAFT_3507528 [Baffinella frigidus]|nr:hypothetical protein T484DRAFT_3507528 [Cryptophyta sp. CCMP2293]